MEKRERCFCCNGLYQSTYLRDIMLDGMPQRVCLRCCAEIEGNEKKMLAEVGVDITKMCTEDANGEVESLLEGRVDKDQSLPGGDCTVPEK
jgi:hypothetical protein